MSRECIREMSTGNMIFIISLHQFTFHVSLAVIQYKISDHYFVSTGWCSGDALRPTT